MRGAVGRTITMTPGHQAESVSLSEWQPTVSGNAELKLSTLFARRVPALKMDFDFKDGGGFVVARRILKRPMPREYAVHFRLRGRGATNNLELKLVDASGLNVWRYVQKDLRLPARWKRISIQSRDIDFAWGPSSGSRISQLGSIEVAIVAGEGRQGHDVDCGGADRGLHPETSSYGQRVERTCRIMRLRGV